MLGLAQQGGGGSSPFITLVFISSKLQGVKRYITPEGNWAVLCIFQNQGVWLFLDFLTPCHILQIDFLTLADLKLNLPLQKSILPLHFQFSDWFKIHVFEHSVLRSQGSFSLRNFSLIISKAECSCSYSKY